MRAILTLPFFGGGKLVWWKAVNFFDESGVGRLASVKEALETLLPDLDKVDGTSVTLLISASGLHKGRAFSKALLKIAHAKYFDLPDLRNTTEDEIIFQIERRMTAGRLAAGGRGRRSGFSRRRDSIRRSGRRSSKSWRSMAAIAGRN